MKHEAEAQEHEESIEERFGHFYEGATIELISYDDLPSAVVQHFEANSRQYIRRDEYVPRNFSSLFKITHPDGTITYGAEQTKTYFPDGDTEDLVYLMDYLDGVPAGYGEIRNNITNDSKYFAGKPFVGFTRTYTHDDKEAEGKDFRRKGLGARRLVEMDAISRSFFGMALNSDSIQASDDLEGKESTPRRIWERFVEEGKAESYVEGVDNDGKKIIRYRMK